MQPTTLVLKLSVSMTKTLSQLLGAQEPAFHQGIRHLERASGRPTEDIRLTNDVNQSRRDCLKQLGLDPDDTTGQELYAALMQRVQEDSDIFDSLIGLASPTDDQVQKQSAMIQNIMPRVAKLVATLQPQSTVMAMKAAAAKRLLKAHPPRKALKALGYRSIDSVLKQEPTALLMTAAAATESAQWQQAMHNAYKKLRPSDFEQRQVQLLAPDTLRWHKLAAIYLSQRQQPVVSFREMGTIVLLPFTNQLTNHVKAAPLTVTLLALQAANDIRATSTYLKLHVVRGDFGQIVAAISQSEPMTQAQLGDSALQWKLIHRHFARRPESYNPRLFEPHVQPEDLHWKAAEDSLAELHPRFEFWQTASLAGLLHQGETISLNLFDSVLNFCNKLPFEQRIVHYIRDRIWHELLLRYMRSATIEQSIQQQLSKELQTESIEATS